MTMDEIKAFARAVIQPGKLDEYKRLCAEAMEIVRTKDTGTLQYELYFNEDESEAITFERYRHADAMLEHFANISHLMEPLTATAKVTGELLGTPNARMRDQLVKVREDLGDTAPTLFTPWLVLQDLEPAGKR
jgi:quinol monooxygenase YgiN